MAQYYEVLSQSDKNSERQFYNNVEERTVQYVITPDKTQVQYPTQQIVVSSGEQLMVVDSQSQQIVIDQSAVTYQSQQIQQTQVQVPQQQIIQQQAQASQQVQVQTQQFAVIHDGSLGGGTQQIFFMEGGSPADRVVVDQTRVQSVQSPPPPIPPQQSQQQQPIVLNHQLGPGGTIVRTPSNNRSTPALTSQQGIQSSVRPGIRSSLPQQRPQARPTGRSLPPNQSPRPTIPHQSALRQPAGGQSSGIRQISPVGSPIRQNQHQMRQPAQIPRPATPGQSQYRGMQPVRLPNQLVRQPLLSPIRTPNQMTQQRMPTQRTSNMPSSRFQGISQLQQQQQSSQQKSVIDMNDLEIKSSDEQEVVSLPDGTIVSIAAYKKLLAEQKARAATQNKPSTPTQISATNPPALTTINSSKRRIATARPRQLPKSGARTSPKAKLQQFPQQQQPSQPQHALMNQQASSMNRPQSSQPFQNQQQQQSSMLMQQQRPSQANYVIQPPKPNQKPQQQRPLPAYIPSSQIQKIIESTPISEEFSDSIRMLVLLENGEQRLITFTLPKEACTIQEILEQVNVPFQSNTNIQVTEANSNGINYIVTVGNVPALGYEDEETPPQEEPNSAPPLQPPPPPPTSLTQVMPDPSSQTLQQLPSPPPAPQVEQSKASSPEPSKETSKFVPGMLALCAACGYLSEDFARCIRCQRKLPDNVKAIPATVRTASANGQKKELSALQIAAQQQQAAQLQQKSSSSSTRAATAGAKKKFVKSKNMEHDGVQVVISSDEEDEEIPSNVSDNILQKLGASVTICPITKEPSLTEIQRHNSIKKSDDDEEEETEVVSTAMNFRTVRIGSYRCIPSDKVIIDSTQVILKVPHPSREDEIVTIIFDRSDIVKVLASFNSSLPVIFYYLNPLLAKKVREDLNMMPDGDYYYDPLSTQDDSYRRITFLPDEISEEDQKLLQLIYGSPPSILDELNIKEANDILIKTCPKEVTKSTLGIGCFTEIQPLLTYPPEGRGRITINTEDYLCLAQDQFLNDVIIDFYLKYLVDNLPCEQQQKVHVFSTFFYKRLTTKPMKASRKFQPAELDPTLTPSQKRHARVKTWTKHVNLFEKDFVVVPINENSHWFLAIICFPGMDGCETYDGQPYKLEIKSKKKKKVQIGNIGSVSISAVKQEKLEKPIVCEDPALSDKDEAEGDDSEMESDDSEELPLSQNSTGSSSSPPAAPLTVNLPKQPKEQRPPIKQPCILIFDSLAGANRSRIVATLRDYLTCEFKAKLGMEKIYNKDVIKGANPKVPQQNNFTDCGLYVLQYVEHFFKDPIKDYYMPIKQIQNWFDEIVVTKKREDIALLIKTLMKEYGKDTRMLPDIVFPTINGKLIERDFEDDDEMLEDEDMPSEEEGYDSKEETSCSLDTSKSEPVYETAANGDEEKEDSKSSIKSLVTPGGDFIVQPVLNQKPDISEFPRQTNKDTLSMLKAKRIIRHKNSGGPELKKMKSDDD